MYSSTHISPFGLLLSAKQLRGNTVNEIPTNTLIELVETHKIVVLRGFRALSQSDFKSFARTLGPLLRWDFGEILNLRVEQAPANHLFNSGRVELHWDGAYIPETPRFNMFQCIDASEEGVGGETLFSNTAKIWQEAKDEERALWSRAKLAYSTQKKAHYGGTILVSLADTHPNTGERVLRFIEPYNEDNALVNPVQCSVTGISPIQTDHFISRMVERFYDDRFLYRHRWKKGDFVIIDNNALLHGRAHLQGNISRHLQRIHVLPRC